MFLNLPLLPKTILLFAICYIIPLDCRGLPASQVMGDFPLQCHVGFICRSPPTKVGECRFFQSNFSYACGSCSYFIVPGYLLENVFAACVKKLIRNLPRSSLDFEISFILFLLYFFET
jgi:hypothetical protein